MDAAFVSTSRPFFGLGHDGRPVAEAFELGPHDVADTSIELLSMPVGEADGAGRGDLHQGLDSRM